MQRADAGGPVVAEKPVQYAGEVEPCDDETAEVRGEGDGGVGLVGRGGGGGG